VIGLDTNVPVRYIADFADCLNLAAAT